MVSDSIGQSANTGGMSANATGTLNYQIPTGGVTSVNSGAFSNPIGSGRSMNSGVDGSNHAYQTTLDVSHSHNFDHYHEFNGTTWTSTGENSSVEHSHTYSGSGTTENGKGTATAFSVLPPYIVKFCWERTA